MESWSIAQTIAAAIGRALTLIGGPMTFSISPASSARRLTSPLRTNSFMFACSLIGRLREP